MRIIPSITLNVDGAYFPSGVVVDVDDELAQNAIDLGIATVATEEAADETAEEAADETVEEATLTPPETATTRAKRKR